MTYRQSVSERCVFFKDCSGTHIKSAVDGDIFARDEAGGFGTGEKQNCPGDIFGCAVSAQRGLLNSCFYPLRGAVSLVEACFDETRDDGVYAYAVPGKFLGHSDCFGGDSRLCAGVDTCAITPAVMTGNGTDVYNAAGGFL